MLFVTHLGLVASIILGMSLTRYSEEWENKVSHMAQLSTSHLSSHNTFLSVSVAGRNYANLLMRSTIDNLKAIPNLKFVEVEGFSDYSNQHLGVRYLLGIDKAWRTEVTTNEVDDLSAQVAQLKASLRNLDANDDVKRKKFTYLINKAETELKALIDSTELQLLAIPDKPSQLADNPYFLETDKNLMHVNVALRNKNGGNIWAVVDASDLKEIQKSLLAEVIKEGLIALAASTLLIYLMTLWLVRPLKNLSASMRSDIEKIDQATIPEIHRKDEIGDLARSYSSLITRINNQLRVLQNQTETDPLTGIGSRYRYNNRAASTVEKALIEGQSVFYLLCDIDNFKRFNDAYGHTEGDNALTSVANVMQNSLFEGELGCRLGGEEFVFILTGENEQHLRERVKHIHQSVRALGIKHKNNAPFNKVTISIGVVVIRPQYLLDNPMDIDQLLELVFETADSMLYTAKDEGRNIVLYADEKQHSS
jgi:diguanylate cyclase (GGDEF)-like protein